LEAGRPDAATIAKVRQSCAAVADRPVQLAESFYEHLFELAPSVRGMFAEDMTLQHERMCRILLEAVTLADQNPEAVELLLHQMGAQHARHFDVVPEHYPYVGRALVRAVRALSPRWSSEVGSAWVQVYEWLAAHMVLGAEGGAALRVQKQPAAEAPAPAQAPAQARRPSPRPRPAPEATPQAPPATGPAPVAGRINGRRSPGRTGRLWPRRHRQASPARTAAPIYGQRGG
jgi:hemoglobin-like flavoprotein